MGYVFLVYCNIVGMELSGFDARVRDLVNPWFRDTDSLETKTKVGCQT